MNIIINEDSYEGTCEVELDFDKKSRNLRGNDQAKHDYKRRTNKKEQLKANERREKRMQQSNCSK